MRAPAFWWKPAPDAIAHLLSPFAAIYGAATARRMSQEGARASVPVICVGNFVAGGAGKTPTAIAIARELQGKAEQPVFLSRGYGASRAAAAPVTVDPAAHTAADVGDEPLLLARIAPTIVCADRIAGARAAAAKGASVIVMDDGLQNPALHKDFRVAVVDGAVGVGNGLCIPAGPLRAPLDAQLAHVDAVVIIGDGAAGAFVKTCADQHGVPVTRGQLAPGVDAATLWRGRRVFAFAGIGRPEKFFATLREIGAEIAGARAFPDHHVFTMEEISRLRGDAARLDAQLITTEKDIARLGAAQDIATLPVSLAFEDASLARALEGFRASR
ncbi:MAG: tetraacyldisaccharide 4'-kinase [Beijerinckiaceae bacterium]